MKVIDLHAAVPPKRPVARQVGMRHYRVTTGPIDLIDNLLRISSAGINDDSVGVKWHQAAFQLQSNSKQDTVNFAVGAIGNQITIPDSHIMIGHENEIDASLVGAGGDLLRRTFTVVR